MGKECLGTLLTVFGALDVVVKRFGSHRLSEIGPLAVLFKLKITRVVQARAQQLAGVEHRDAFSDVRSCLVIYREKVRGLFRSSAFQLAPSVSIEARSRHRGAAVRFAAPSACRCHGTESLVVIPDGNAESIGRATPLSGLTGTYKNGSGRASCAIGFVVYGIAPQRAAELGSTCA